MPEPFLKLTSLRLLNNFFFAVHIKQLGDFKDKVSLSGVVYHINYKNIPHPEVS